MSQGAYRTPDRQASAGLRAKRSRFLALLEPCRVNGAVERIHELEQSYRNATHVCWAWRFGEPARERSSDAGEPAGTAGEPILRVLRGAGISDVLGVVVRWYGGIRLGKGGLARAYAGAMREALEHATLVERIPSERLVVETSFAGVGAIQRLVHPPEVRLIERTFSERVSFELEVHRSRTGELLERLAELGVEVRRGTSDS